MIEPTQIEHFSPGELLNFGKSPICHQCNRFGHYARDHYSQLSAHLFRMVSHDSACSCHMTGRKDWFTNFSTKGKGQVIKLANGEKLISQGSGDVRVVFKGQDHEYLISDVMYVPDLASHLLSVDALIRKNYEVRFDANGCHIYDVDDNSDIPILSAKSSGGIYQLETAHPNYTSHDRSHELWHQRPISPPEPSLDEFVEK